MKDTINIHDEDARGNRVHSFRMPNSQDKILVKDLIKSRVKNEIERFNVQRPVCFFSLVQPEDAEITARGYRLMVHRAIDWAAQSDAALEGFEKKCFLINANGKDYQALDDEVEIGNSTEITFVKFM